MNLKEMPTSKLFPYSEMVTTMINELDNFGSEVEECHAYGGMTLNNKKEIQDKLTNKILKLDDVRIDLVKEINRRLKKDLGIGFGPSDVQPYLNKILTEFPTIGKGESEIKMMVEKERRASISNDVSAGEVIKTKPE